MKLIRVRAIRLGFGISGEKFSQSLKDPEDPDRL